MQPAIGKDKAFMQRFIFVMGQRLDTSSELVKDVYIIILRLHLSVRASIRVRGDRKLFNLS